MNTQQPDTHRVSRTDRLPGYVHHASFDEATASTRYGPEELLANEVEYSSRYMPDEITREHAQLMHYAAFRMHKAKRADVLARWNANYLSLRDRIVLGNRKLIYGAVRRRMALQNRADDMIGDCHIVLIQSVAAFNPWLSIRFSTYAYTCLVRALSRISQRLAVDWLSRALPFDSLPDGEPHGFTPVSSPSSAGSFRVDEFLRDGHPLLNDREKAILTRRFSMSESTGAQTLERVGEAMGLSKERVRQVQASALDKLRKALA